MPSEFAHLYKVVNDEALLLEAYDRFLRDLFERPLWTRGSVAMQRVAWSEGGRAQKEDRESFGSPGLYIWGAQERPIYIGMAERQTFERRFKRYIGQTRSQCNLAKEYASQLITDDIDGFPTEVRDWYKRSFRGSTVRLRHAVRFAREGIDDIWFALLPHHDPNEVKALESALIPVAQNWNQSHGLDALLNVQHNRQQ